MINYTVVREHHKEFHTHRFWIIKKPFENYTDAQSYVSKCISNNFKANEIDLNYKYTTQLPSQPNTKEWLVVWINLIDNNSDEECWDWD